MSNEPSAPTTPRQPLSLRELFCLTTLAGASLTLVLRSSWTDHERWLLGMTLGGTLIGIAVARACKQRGWIAGILAGTLGGMIAVGIIGQDWLAELAELASESWTAEELADFQNDFIAAAATTAGLSVLLAMLSVACFQFLVWATDGGQHGMMRAASRHPYRSAAIATIAGGLVIGIGNIDFLLAPQAWSPRHVIPLSPLERPLVSNHGMWTVRTGSLSRHGDWLLVESYMPGIGREVADKEMYRLDPRPRVVPFTQRPDRASFVAFDCDENRVAFLEWLGEFYEDRPAETHKLRIVDLNRNTSATLSEKPHDSNLHSIQWLPGGTLVIHYGDAWNGKRGFTKLQPQEGQWSRQDSDKKTEFDPRSGMRLESSGEGVRIVDLKSSRQVASFSHDWVDEMMEGLGGDPSDWLKVSPDSRFILAGSKIYDCESRTVRDWRVADGFPQPWFHAFTSRGYALYDDQSIFIACHPRLFFLTDVPLGSRLLHWLMREPVRLIDPGTGLEVARTRPLWSPPDSVALSYDGARMAVFTNDGVYVYDVPAKFR